VLKGTIPIQLEKEKKTTVLIDKLLEAKWKECKLGNSTIKLDEVWERKKQHYSLYLTLAGDLAEQDQRLLYDDLELLDEKGNHFELNGTGVFKGETTSMRLHYSPGTATGPAVRLVYTTRVTLDYTLPFEFRDLPLP
jgi:hypothetical protein